jgi:hypothetical protein
MSRYTPPSIQPGDVFNHLTTIKCMGVSKYQCRRYLFKCVCGKEVEALGYSVMTGHRRSCGCKRKHGGRHKKLGADIIGKRFGRLVVLHRDPAYNPKKSKWICQCDCGNKKSIPFTDLNTGKTVSCGCQRKENMRKIGLWKKRKMHHEIPHWFFYRLEVGAKQRDLTVSITIDDIYRLYNKQEKRCYFTGLPVGFNDDLNTKSVNASHTASVDRLDSTRDYSLDNICISHKDINRMKNNMPLDRFLEYCRLIAEQHPRKPESVQLHDIVTAE